GVEGICSRGPFGVYNSRHHQHHHYDPGGTKDDIHHCRTIDFLSSRTTDSSTCTSTSKHGTTNRTHINIWHSDHPC
ncbi:hypothetical protein NDU88_007185, partial [Pleurodeles waltl]